MRKYFLFNGRIGFDSKKYVHLEARALSSIAKKVDKLYLEIGGKLFKDYHASRVLPGYEFDAKINVLKSLEMPVEFVIVLSAKDVVNKKMSSIGLCYVNLALYISKLLISKGFKSEVFVINAFRGEQEVLKLKKVLEARGKRVYLRPYIENYPLDVDLIASNKGFAKKPFIETNERIVAIVAPGPGSGKMCTALTMLYQDVLNGKLSSYRKLETFPVWNLPLNSFINLAYEAATANLGDVNVIDPFEHSIAINYNRDVKTFPLLRKIIDTLFPKEHPMQACTSPTKMGINLIRDAITNLGLCESAAKEEILRRYYWHRDDDADTKKRMEKILIKARLSPHQRKVVLLSKKHNSSALISPDGNYFLAKNQNFEIEITEVAYLLTSLYNIQDQRLYELVEWLNKDWNDVLSAQDVISFCLFFCRDRLWKGCGADAHFLTRPSQQEILAMKRVGVWTTYD